jgi:hypothetical protein
MLTQERIKSVLHYEPHTGFFTWLVRSNNFVKLGSVAGTVNKHGYTMVRIDKVHYPAHRLAFLYMTGAFPEHDTDHINGMRTDNRWANLRAVTRSENQQNLGGARANNRHGLLGVFPVSAGVRFRAGITINGKKHNLGTFDTPEQAHEAYRQEKARLHTHNNRLLNSEKE